jgi:hypothetical protein
MQKTVSIAYFITPHGFGHASRSCAVMQAMRRKCPDIFFEIFTTSPIFLFEDSMHKGFRYHHIKSDIGIIQESPFKEDLVATCDQLDRMLPFDNAWLNELADQVSQYHCKLVICDIAPLGIAVARMIGVPSVLIENFTWDWIYEEYLPLEKRFETPCSVSVQSLPVCRLPFSNTPAVQAVRKGYIHSSHQPTSPIRSCTNTQTLGNSTGKENDIAFHGRHSRFVRFSFKSVDGV